MQKFSSNTLVETHRPRHIMDVCSNGIAHIGHFINKRDLHGQKRIRRIFDELSRYRIVGADEFDEDDNYISVDSPVAKALLGKAVDDEVEVQTPVGKQYYLIATVSYADN